MDEDGGPVSVMGTGPRDGGAAMGHGCTVCCTAPRRRWGGDQEGGDAGAVGLQAGGRGPGMGALGWVHFLLYLAQAQVGGCWPGAQEWASLH
jgi:hypothetical protein